MNSCLELDESAWPTPNRVGYPMPSFLDTGAITWPSEVIVLFDQLLEPEKGFDGEHELGTAGQHCGSYPIAFAARHRMGGSKLGGNILYADYHVEWHGSVWKKEWGEWQVGTQQSPPREDRNWYPYPVPEEG